MKTMEKSEFEKLNAFGTGRDNTAYARYFIGRSYLNPLTKPQEGLALSNVTFEPGCRNNWHIHHATAGGGQILICTAGEGWYQEEGKAPVSLKPGMVVAIPANVKHWHGAKADRSGFPISRLRSPAKTAAPNGASLSRTRSTTPCKKKMQNGGQIGPPFSVTRFSCLCRAAKAPQNPRYPPAPSRWEWPARSLSRP